MTDATAQSGPAIDLTQPSLYLNRELSWLAFDARVLAEALDARTPLLERLKFLAIWSSNLDEFFQVRVAGLHRQVAAGYTERTADGMTPDDQLQAIVTLVTEQQEAAHRCLTEELLPALVSHGIRLVTDPETLTAADLAQLNRYFQTHVFPVLIPLAVDPEHPFPYISTLSLSLAVSLRLADGSMRFARVKVPKILPRWIPLPTAGHYLPLEQVIGLHLEALFPGVEILGWSVFRITRNADLQIDHDEAEDLLSLIQEEVRNRRFGEVVRLEVHPSMPATLRTLLLAEFIAEQEPSVAALAERDVYQVPGLLDFSDLMALATLDLPALRDPVFHPVIPAPLAAGSDIFEVIRQDDVLVHHPYESFPATVERFLQRAVDDPDVLAIKLTLYRTGGDSSQARMLSLAAERGKQVAVLIELQARFDEENNIVWAQRLEDAGVHVSYGVAGLKTHCKVLLVVRREGAGLRRYSHIGTGNYNARTSRIYTDFGLFTADEDIGADLSDLFNVLTGFGAPPGYRKLMVAPQGMRDAFTALIRREADHARAGRPARLIAKMNALVDERIIRELYLASQAGVTVDLMVRGICCLRPGLPGVSERIRVVSIIGRFLEHSRAWYFLNDGAEEVYLGSADWMPRNLDRRIEVVTPVHHPRHRRTVRDLLESMWRDNRQAWELQPHGRWLQRNPAAGEAEHATHRQLLEEYGALAPPLPQ